MLAINKQSDENITVEIMYYKLLTCPSKVGIIIIIVIIIIKFCFFVELVLIQG